MSSLRLAWESFSFYIKRNILVIIGVALSTAVLTGALFIGDSLRYSLEQITLSRLGNTTHLVSVNGRYFRTELADETGEETGASVAPVLILDGIAIAEGGEKRADNIQITGIDRRFQAISGSVEFNGLSANEIIISDNLAHRLEVKAGDDILVRIARASSVPGNAPFVSERESTVPFRANIRLVVTARQLGNFNLQNTQVARYNVFMSLDQLNRLMELKGRANRLLVAGETNTETISSALSRHLVPEDVGLIYRTIAASGESEISAERVFMEEKVTRTFGAVLGSRVIMAWFVNKIGYGAGEVPYSFAASWPGAGLSEGDILVNEWVAGDLGIKAGDTLAVTYFKIGSLRQLTEKSINLTVKQVVPLSGPFADKELAPRIPGLYDAGHCREWEAGVPVQLDKIRQKDEDYWNIYKGTPKMFVSPELADSLWSNQFGNSTAIRFSPGVFPEEKFRQIFREKFEFSDFGFIVQPVQENGLKAARNGVDFGQLFLGLSFFLLISAIILTSLLFRLNLENRVDQIGTLLQLGFTKKQTGRIILTEGMAIAVAGVLTGLLLSVVYVRVVFAFLNSLWWDIVRTSMIFLKIETKTLVIGAIISFIVAYLSVRFPLRHFLKRRVISLVQKNEAIRKVRPEKMLKFTVPLFFIAALIPLTFRFIGGKTLDTGLFFVSGGLMLSGFLLLSILILAGAENFMKGRLDMKYMGIRMIARNRRRSLAIIILFALGTFIVLSTGANRRDILPGSKNKQSGTGGFGYFAETSVPVLFDLNDTGRRLKEGIDTTFRIVQFNKLAGDDASCLNLNRISNPAILGVDTETLVGRFSFITHSSELNLNNPWISLKDTLPGGLFPAVADQTVIEWGLGMKTGDTLMYQSEKGDTLRVKLIGGLAPSVFQGNILVDNSVFLRFYPSHSGSSIFLTGCSSSGEEKIAGELQSLLRDSGIEITSTSERLAEFNSISNTYLSIFLALGVLGLILGTIGLSVILARSVFERRRELAIMSAIGFPKGKIVNQLMTEYGLLLVYGVGTGFISSFAALSPGMVADVNSVPGWYIIALITLISFHGIAWIYVLSIALVKNKFLIPSLKDE